MLAGETRSLKSSHSSRETLTPTLEAASTTVAKETVLSSCSLVMPGGFPDGGQDQVQHSPSPSAAQDLPIPSSGIKWDTWGGTTRTRTEMTVGTILDYPGAGAPHQASPLTFAPFLLPSPCGRAGTAPLLTSPLVHRLTDPSDDGHSGTQGLVTHQEDSGAAHLTQTPCSSQKTARSRRLEHL